MQGLQRTFLVWQEICLALCVLLDLGVCEIAAVLNVGWNNVSGKAEAKVCNDISAKSLLEFTIQHFRINFDWLFSSFACKIR